MTPLCARSVAKAVLNPRFVSQRLFHSSAKTLNRADLTDINPSEKSHFKGLAATWWDETGSQRILHKMNLLRMDFINDTIKSQLKLNQGVMDPEDRIFIPGWNYHNVLPEAISNDIQKEIDGATRQKLSEVQLKCLDIGCGGGILSESLARLPIVESVKGIDMTPEVIKVANEHKELDPCLEGKLSYEIVSLDRIADDEKYDMITMMELLEHVDYPATVMKQALSHLNPGGYLFVSTINRDLVSWFTTIFMGEYVLGIVPIGTHTYLKYIKESELKEYLDEFKNDFEVVDSKGCAYFPAVGWFYTGINDMGNYMMAIRRK
ncbi:DEKNAAC100260 [Brettanomyces naardenensis]|uniref:Ubiquinone biosynthesis O-methyltransferase, mitochondrial n=1 Tax=Brettanomyces naardenensis TaxID=13370 RepID=A0A448YGQ6_BRENA|nr:DEKNAAC100260 [Brettanomyces naardenensis]